MGRGGVEIPLSEDSPEGTVWVTGCAVEAVISSGWAGAGDEGGIEASVGGAVCDMMRWSVCEMVVGRCDGLSEEFDFSDV